MRIKISTLRQLIREAIEEATCECGGMKQGESCNQCGGGMAESDKEDKDKDGDKDFADVQMARMMASGMSKQDAMKKSRKHNESFKRRLRRI